MNDFTINDENIDDLLSNIDEGLQRNDIYAELYMKIDEEDVELKIGNLELYMSFDTFENEIDLTNYVIEQAIKHGIE